MEPIGRGTTMQESQEHTIGGQPRLGAKRNGRNEAAKLERLDKTTEAAL